MNEFTLDDIKVVVRGMKAFIRQEYRNACDEFWTAVTKDDKDEAIEVQRRMDELSAIAKECFFDVDYNDSFTLLYLGKMASEVKGEPKAHSSQTLDGADGANRE